jgi:hypothetical protein
MLLNRASQEFSPEDVCQMYDLLLPRAESLPEFGKKELRKQLNREFGVDLDKSLLVRDKRHEERRQREGKTAEQEQQEVNGMYQELLDKIEEMSATGAV